MLRSNVIRALAPAPVLVFTFLVTTNVAGCGDSKSGSSTAPDGSGGASDDGGDGGIAPPSPLEWSSCAGAGTGRSAECASMTVPLDWSKPGGKTIDVRVRRSLAPTQPAPRALWYLTGGPGSPGDVAIRGEPIKDGYDLYSIDFRGTGSSSPFDCKELDAAAVIVNDATLPLISACGASLKATFGDDLVHFSTSNDARDVIEAMRRAAVEGQKRIVLGNSFGTIRAQRLLQLAPAGTIDGVVLDAVASPQRSWPSASVSFDSAVKALLALCVKEDTYCADKLNPDPDKLLSDVAAVIAAGSCPTSGNITADQYRSTFAQALAAGIDMALPALMWRIRRCEAADHAPIQHFVNFIKATVGTPSSVNYGLHFHIVFSEFTSATEKSAAELTSIAATSVASMGEAATYRTAYETWPRSPHDPLGDTFAQTNVPMLFMVGSVDPLTTPEEGMSVKAHFTAPQQTLAVVVGGAHGVAWRTSCSSSITAAFMKNPTEPLDVSCLSQGKSPYPFRGTTATANSYFGTTDLWENL